MRTIFRRESWRGLSFAIPAAIGILLGSGGDRWLWLRIAPRRIDRDSTRDDA